jgi:thiamine pyrophosphokinase
LSLKQQRAVIFANGELSHSESVLRLLQPGDLIIAADGGGKHCQELGLQPHLLVGDMDSLDPAAAARFEAAGSQVLRYPTHKDYTDLELALQQALEHGADDIIVVGALGRRWDQTLANLLLPVGQAFKDASIRVMDGPQEIQILRPGKWSELYGQPGDTLSLIPLLGDALGIRTQGLEYPLTDENLEFGSTRGISNVLLESAPRIYLRQGLLLCVLIHGSLD